MGRIRFGGDRFRPAGGIVSPMIPLAVSGPIVITVAVVGALVLMAILLRIEE